VDIQNLFRCWPSKGAVLMFGMNGAYREETYTCKNPAPILRLSLDRLAFDVDKASFAGDPRSEVVIHNSPGLNLGRIGASACPANDDTASKIFCCGGRYMADESMGSYRYVLPIEMKMGLLRVR
jgi:hypothetical protein